MQAHITYSRRGAPRARVHFSCTSGRRDVRHPRRRRPLGPDPNERAALAAAGAASRAATLNKHVEAAEEVAPLRKGNAPFPRQTGPSGRHAAAHSFPPGDTPVPSTRPAHGVIDGGRRRAAEVTSAARHCRNATHFRANRPTKGKRGMWVNSALLFAGI